MAWARGEGEGHTEGLTEKKCDGNKEVIVENEAGKGFEFKSKMLAINKMSPKSFYFWLRWKNRPDLPFPIKEKKKRLKNRRKYRKQWMLNFELEAAQDSGPWERANKWSEPSTCPSLLPAENVQATPQRGEPRQERWSQWAELSWAGRAGVMHRPRRLESSGQIPQRTELHWGERQGSANSRFTGFFSWVLQLTHVRRVAKARKQHHGAHTGRASAWGKPHIHRA